MRMKHVDNVGAIYSSSGVRFGGFQTAEFLVATESLESLRPGVREEIIAEAHYLVNWLHRFPEVVFVLGLLLAHSLMGAFLLFVVAYVMEYARFYVLGPSRLVSSLCRSWEWIKVPVCLLVAVLLWNTSRVQAVATVVFLLAQGWLTLGTTVVLFPVRLLLNTALYRRFSHLHPQIHNTEGIALMEVIGSWTRRLNPPGSSRGPG